MGKKKKANGDTLHKIGLASAGREVTRRVDIGFGDQVKVELPAAGEAHVREQVESEGLRILSRKTAQVGARTGQGTETFLLSLAEGRAEGHLTVRHVDRNNPQRILRHVEIEVYQVG